MPASERDIPVSPLHSVRLAEPLAALVEKPPDRDYVVRTLVKREANGLPLMSADLVTYGEELVWERCAGEVRHTARLRIDGTFLLADGERVFATPSAATTALSGKHHHGWSAWRRPGGGCCAG